ncbi:MAG: twin-arginine translocation signal domain-containing protein, partial [Acidobacteriota bacterium]
MNRRDLLKASLLGAAAPAFAASGRQSSTLGCDDCVVDQITLAMPSAPRLKVTGIKTFGVTSDVLPSDRPHVFVKVETDAGVVGWGEATLEGKAAAAMQAVHDLSYAIMGQDPMHVE